MTPERTIFCIHASRGMPDRTCSGNYLHEIPAQDSGVFESFACFTCGQKIEIRVDPWSSVKGVQLRLPL